MHIMHRRDEKGWLDKYVLILVTFFFMGAITLFLDFDTRSRAWLIALPFLGVLIDIAAIWLKGNISPVFFWLHVPGGGLFVLLFVFLSDRGFFEMW